MTWVTATGRHSPRTMTISILMLRARAAEEEVTLLRRRLQRGPRRVQTLEEKLLETKGQLAQAISQNEKLTFTLQTARSTSPTCVRRWRSSRSPVRLRDVPRHQLTTARSTCSPAVAR